MAGSKSSSNGGATKRLYVLGGILFLWVFAVFFRLVQLQVIKYGEFQQRAARQQQRTIDVSPRRGLIYDRNGHELAMSVNVDSVFAVPSEVPDQINTANLLAGILKMDSKDLLAKMKASHSFCWIARKLDADVSARIRSLNLRGIYFQQESKRYYPKRELAAQVLGYVGMDDEGLAGLEHVYQDTMAGKPGTMMISMDARRRRFARVEKKPEAGDNLVLTIDEKIQWIVEREIDRAMEETKAVAAWAVVQNPRTGEILALVNRPTFDPNSTRKITPAMLKNHAVTDVFEPGSIFKIVTYSAAMNEGLMKPTEMIDTQGGAINVNGLVIHDPHPVGTVNATEAFAKSSDVAAVKAALRLGEDRFYKYIREYGFGQQTGIELPGETRGLAKPTNKWSKVSIGAMSIGQEIGVTPLQAVSMVSTIANDGVYTPPRIVAGVMKPNTTGPQTISFKPPQTRRVISTMTAAQMRQMMEQVVLFGTGRRAILDGYTSAGKTGTAQKVDPKTGRYSHTDYVASFSGFAPVNNPAISIIVSIDSAKGLHQGGQISAPVFARIAQQVLAYMHVPHDVESKNDKLRMLRAKVKDEELEESGQHVGEPIEVAQDETPPAQLPTKSISAPMRAAMKGAPAKKETIAQLPPPPDPVQPNGTVVLDVGGGPTVPSFLGKSLRSAIEMAQTNGIELNVIGSGTAREQSPPPGSRMPAGGRVAVRFSR
ncbi:MAG TPA: penicillin-binding protein [Terriglobales bacterium]|nr:penicillin-binding protein [Terriglobales bacterium]